MPSYCGMYYCGMYYCGMYYCGMYYCGMYYRGMYYCGMSCLLLDFHFSKNTILYTVANHIQSFFNPPLGEAAVHAASLREDMTYDIMSSP